MQPIQYEMDAEVRDVGGENNTSDEMSGVNLGRSHEHYLCGTFALRPHDGEPIKIQLMYRDVPDVALEKQHGAILLDVGLMCLSYAL